MQEPTYEAAIDEAEASIPTESKRNDRRMSGVLRRKVAARTFLPMPFQQPHPSPPPAQAEDRLEILMSVAAERPLLDIPISIAENEATVTPASYNDWVVVASSNSPAVASLAHPQKWEPAEKDKKPAETTARRMGKWSAEEDSNLIEALKKHKGNWVTIAQLVPGRDHAQCHSRWSKSLARKLEPAEVDEKPTEIRTGKWEPEEDLKLIEAVKQHGTNWMAVASMVPSRTNVQCRCRNTWVMRLDPSLSGPTAHAGKRTMEEDTKLPNVSEDEAELAPTAATMTSASSTSTVSVSRADTATVASPLKCMDGSRVVPPRQLQQDEGTPAAKRPRFENSPPIAEVEVVDISTVDSVVTASSNHKVAAVRTYTTRVGGPLPYMPYIGVPRAFARKWTPAGAGKRIEAVITRNKAGAVASMVPARQSQNMSGAAWAKVLNPRMIDRSKSHWTAAEDNQLLHLVNMIGMRWVLVAEGMPCRTYLQCRNRWLEYFDHNVDRATGPWTTQEDVQLFNAVMKQQGERNDWVEVAAQVPTRAFHQCKQRWVDHLKPANHRVGKWTDEEDELLVKAVKNHGKKWMAVARGVPGRSNIQCQKRWTSSVVHNGDWATGDWTISEDALLTSAVEKHGKNWGAVGVEVPDRSHAQCRRRFEER
jgi:hypothetical protein